MKKLKMFLLIFSFVLSGIGGIFLFGANATNQYAMQSHAPVKEDITEYTYKTYDDYFIDFFNFPSDVWTTNENGAVIIDYSKIEKSTSNDTRILSYNGTPFFTLTSEDLSGKGKENNPYIVKSLYGFLYITNQDLFGQSAKPYVEFACDIVLNDECFDADGNPSGGDGIIYSWQASNVFILPYIEGNNHTIYGLYANRLNKTCGKDCDKNGDGQCSGKCQEGVALFGAMIQKVSNLTFENVFLSGKKYVYPISSARIYDVVNCHAKNGGIIADAAASGLGYEIFNGMKDCTSNLRIKQNENTTSASGFSGLCYSVGVITNCINYGDVIASKKVSYLGGICASLYTKMENCVNYGNVYLDESAYCTGVGGLIGVVLGAEVLNSKNYGNVTGEKALYNVKTGGLAGYLSPNDDPALFENCVNYGEITNGCGFVGQGKIASFADCINYGNIKQLGCAFAYYLFTQGSDVAPGQTMINCVNYGDIENTEKSTFSVLFTNFNFKSSLDIISCSNYGVISGVSSGDIVEFFGNIRGISKVNITNFRNESNVTTAHNADFYIASTRGESNFSVVKSYFEFKNTSIRLLYVAEEMTKVEMYNVEIVSEGANTNAFLLNDISGKVCLENVIIKRSLNLNSSKLMNYSLYKLLRATAVVQIENVLIETKANNRIKKEYIGSDFSAFYFSWRTGKIGLATIDGAGAFQGSIDEDWLKNKGYEKKNI